MCRIAAYRGTNPKEVERIFSALKRSAAHDTTLERIGAKDPRHLDGGGFAISVPSERFWAAAKTTQPVFESSLQLPDLTGMHGEIFAIFHAQKKDAFLRRFKLGVTLPVIIETPWSTIAIATNGSGVPYKGNGENGYSLGSNQIIMNRRVYPDGSHSTNIHYWNLFHSASRREYYTLYRQTLENGVAVVSSTLALQEGIGGQPIRFGKVYGLRA